MMASRAEIDPGYYPKSFFKLLLFACALVAAPLVIAFVNAAIYLERLAEQSQSAVAQSARAAQASRLLMEQVTALERTVRQYLVLGDRDLLDGYATLRARFESTTSELSLLPLDEKQLLELNRTIDKEQMLYETLQRMPMRSADKSALNGGYVELSALARGVLETSNALIDREIEQLRLTGQHAQRVLWLQFVATLPLGVLSACAASLLVVRPIRELDRAIRRLGGGDYANPVGVRGPADIAYLGNRLDWLRQRLVELEQHKQVFLRHVSHELKTPLTALREGSELLAEETTGPLSERQREIVGILRQKSLDLQSMIEELLDYHRAHDSLAQLQVAPVRLDQLLGQTLEDHRLEIQTRGIRTDVRTEPVVIHGDAEKLRTVLDNLLSNAIKYSPQGSTLALALGRQNDRVDIDIADEGPGVPPEYRERIFDWFFQAGRGHNGRIRGSGLGLAIAREFVAAHRGSIVVADDGARGAHLRVSLPVVADAGAARG